MKIQFFCYRIVIPSHFGSILFRDLKPSNVGISSEGIPLIFDFGLARELKAKDRVDEEGYYKLTKMVGSLRYVVYYKFLQHLNFEFLIISLKVICLQKSIEETLMV